MRTAMLIENGNSNVDTEGNVDRRESYREHDN